MRPEYGVLEKEVNIAKGRKKEMNLDSGEDAFSPGDEDPKVTNAR